MKKTITMILILFFNHCFSQTTIYGYEKFGENSLDSSLTHILKYDANNRLLEEVFTNFHYDKYSECVFDRVLYSYSGNYLIKEFRYSIDSTTIYAISDFQYNSDSLLLIKKTNNINNNFKQTEKYLYDSTQLKQIEYSRGGKVYRKTIVEYIDDSTYFYEKGFLSKDLYKIETKSNLDGLEHEYIKWIFSETNNWSYQKNTKINNKLINSESYNISDGGLEHKIYRNYVIIKGDQKR